MLELMHGNVVHWKYSEWFLTKCLKIDELRVNSGKALELDPNDPEAQQNNGAVKLLFEGDMDTATFIIKSN